MNKRYQEKKWTLVAKIGDLLLKKKEEKRKMLIDVR